MDRLDELLEPAYKTADFRAIAESLGVSELSAEQQKQLQLAAQGYRVFEEVEAKPKPGENWLPIIPNRSERREALKRVAIAVKSRTTVTPPSDGAKSLMERLDRATGRGHGWTRNATPPD